MVKKKKQKVVNNVSRVIYIIYLIMSIITVVTMLTLNILPIKYLLLFLLIYLIITILLGVMVFISKIKIKLKITTSVICCLFIVVYGFGFYYLNKTLSFMDIISAKNYQIIEYYLLVLKDSDYQNVNDINGLRIGTYENELNYESAIHELDKKIDFKEKTYSNYVEAATALLNNQEQIIFINSSHKLLLDEQLDQFDEKVKVLETIQVKIENTTVREEVDVTKESFNVYISGIDIYGDISLVSRSDVNMIATINPKTHQVLLTSIPRDYYVQLHGTTGYKDKLTHAGIYGIDMSITTIEDLFSIDIDYYIRVNFTTLIKMVDAIGGVDIYSDLNFTAYTNRNCHYKVGNNHLDGDCALAFSRERYAYQEGDRHRVQNQQAVITVILNKALSSKTFITKYTSILESLGSSFQTNIPQDKIYSLVNMQLDTMPRWNINSISVNGSDSHNYTYSYSAGKLYVMEPDRKTVATATAKIKEIEEGR